MCNTCCNSCNSCNGCGRSLFDTLFGCPCRRCGCNCGCGRDNDCRSNGCGCNAAQASVRAAENALAAARAAAREASCGCNDGCGCNGGWTRVSVPVSGRLWLNFSENRGREGGYGFNATNFNGNDGFDAYYARQYGLYPYNTNHTGCGCGN